MHYDVTQVVAKDNLTLRVRFQDGLEGEVIFKPEHLHGVFQALKNPQIFSQVHCAEGFVAWPGDIDLAPDAMYESIRQHGRWILS